MGQKCFETPGGGSGKPQHRIVDFRVQEKPTDEAGDPVMITSNNKSQKDVHHGRAWWPSKSTYGIPRLVQ